MTCNIEVCKFYLDADEPEKREAWEKVEVELHRGPDDDSITMPSFPNMQEAIAWLIKWADDRGFEAYLKTETTGTIDVTVYLRHKETA
jgi:hypothetical protein